MYLRTTSPNPNIKETALLHLAFHPSQSSTTMSNSAKSASGDPRKLSEFFIEATKLLGNDHVSITAEHGAVAGPQVQDLYGDAFSPTTKNRASGAVRPRSIEEVQHILKLANSYKIPLWTVSRGKNLGYSAILVPILPLSVTPK